MAMAREDKRFVAGLAAAVVVLGLYALAVRGPLRGATGRSDREIRARRPKVDLYFRNPKATPFSRVQRELAQRVEALDRRLAALAAAVEFDPGSLEPASESSSATADPRDLYFKLTSALHDTIKAKAERSPHLVRVPTVFDPQGHIQTPRDPAAIPRLHRQLVMAYRILDAAIDHRVHVAELRAPQPRVLGASARPYLDELTVVVKAQGDLDAIAAWLHALGQPPAGKTGSRFLSVATLDVVAGEDKEPVGYEVAFVSVRIHPTVTLAGGPARTDDGKPPARRPRRAPLY